MKGGWRGGSGGVHVTGGGKQVGYMSRGGLVRGWGTKGARQR